MKVTKIKRGMYQLGAYKIFHHPTSCGMAEEPQKCDLKGWWDIIDGQQYVISTPFPRLKKAVEYLKKSGLVVFSIFFVIANSSCSTQKYHWVSNENRSHQDFLYDKVQCQALVGQAFHGHVSMWDASARDTMFNECMQGAGWTVKKKI